MQIGYVTTEDASDVKLFSGIHYHLTKALEESGVSVVPISGFKITNPPSFLLKRGWTTLTTKKTFSRQFDLSVLRNLSKQLAIRLKDTKVDLLLVPGTFPVPAAFLETTLPIVFWGDCFSRLLIRDYGFESFLHADSMKNSEEIDRRLFANASVVIFTSDYAARQAIDRYGLDEKKVAVVWFGANLPETGERKEEILAIARKRPADHLKLLFMTTDWNRKRGDLALQVAEQLNSRGIKTELNILGRIPESVSQSLPSFVTVLGSVDKTKPEDVRRMQTFLSENHFLLLPSSADFTPHSIGEANSRATPVIASNVGGLPTLMRDGLNGYMIDAGCGAEAYVEKIANLWSDQVAYQSLCESSYEQFLERLNWKTAIRLFCDVVDDRVGLAS